MALEIEHELAGMAVMINLAPGWSPLGPAFRRIATRYDKLASRFSSFIALAATLIWLQ